MKRLFVKSSLVSLFVFTSAFVFAFAARAQGNPMSGKLVVSPSAQTVQTGQTLTVTVTVDSGAEPVNAVQANITYPKESLEFIKVDTMDTAYDVEAENKNVNGVVRLARGSTKPLTGEQLFAKIEFKAKKTTQAMRVTYAKDSEIIRTADNQNILADGGKKQAPSVIQPDVTKPNDAASPTASKKKTSFWMRLIGFFKSIF